MCETPKSPPSSSSRVKSTAPFMALPGLSDSDITGLRLVRGCRNASQTASLRAHAPRAFANSQSSAPNEKPTRESSRPNI
eukprot:4268224-Pyramimonas_sp.AAC.1